MQLARLAQGAEHPSRHLQAIDIQQGIARNRSHTVSTGDIGAKQHAAAAGRGVDQALTLAHRERSDRTPVQDEASACRFDLGLRSCLLSLRRFEHLERCAGTGVHEAAQSHYLGRCRMLGGGCGGYLARLRDQLRGIQHDPERGGTHRCTGGQGVGDVDSGRPQLFGIET